MTMTSVESQVVVVGATGEVGAAIVGRLREAAVGVVAVARDRARLEQLSANDDGITPCPADIGDDSSVRRSPLRSPGRSGWRSNQQPNLRAHRWP